MNKTILLLLGLLFTMSVSAQQVKVQQDDSYLDFIDILNSSKDLRYNSILAKYDRYIKVHPNAVKVQIYRCKFIGNAYYDEYEESDDNWEETQSCKTSLFEKYPNHPDVLLYKLENTYGEDRGELIENLLDLYEAEKGTWLATQTTILFQQAARFYTSDNDYKALEYAKIAEKYDDSIDLSLLKANAYLRLDDKDNAKRTLLKQLNFEHDNWELNQKAVLLISLDEDQEALKLYDRIKLKDSSYSNNESLYKIFLNKENHAQARTYLVNDTIYEWNRATKLQKLLSHDIAYSSPETALRSYRRMQQESYYDDFFGIKRLRLAFKAPAYYWTFSEISHLFVLLAFIILLFLIPYLWILPIYAISKYFKFKSVAKAPKIPGAWSLKHFWLTSFLYLLTQSILVLVFYYQSWMNDIFDIGNTYSDDILPESDLTSANAQLVFCGLLLVFTLVLVNKIRLKFILNSTATLRQIFGLSILFLFFNGIILKILGQFVDLSEMAEYISSLSAKDEIMAIVNEYGFYITVLFVALIVPFYEEIIFRGIILSSTEKHLGFKAANIVQAVLFATVHYSLNLFLFYFIFGLVTGYFVKRTQGLITGIAFHALNNFMAVVSIYYLSKLVL